ncbi:MAG: asparagine synthase-related protein [Pseudomonadota bacterium]
MYRFIALSWNDSDLAKTAAARRLAQRIVSSSPDWQSVLDLPGLRVLHVCGPGGARRAYVLKRDTGVVLGKLFSSKPGPHEPAASFTAVSAFDDAESDRLIETHGRRLTERYWGHYVAFLREPGGKRRFVLRDPTGGLPCYVTRTAGVDVFLSDMEDCAELNLAPFSADWDHLTAFLLYSELNTRRTGLRGVTQLYAGECVTIAENGATSRCFYWHPADVSETRNIDDPDQARAMLGASVRRCTEAWTSSYESVLQELSGGLDSSIVAACAANSNTQTDILGFHFFTETSEGDERSYARTAAASAGIELIEAECRLSATSLERQLDPLRVATPAVLGFIPPSERLRRRLAQERRAGAVFTGQGGDHLFQELASELIAAEYVHRNGLRSPLLKVIANTSRLTQTSVWSVLATALAYGMLGRSFDPYEAYVEAPSILSSGARAAITRAAYSHPWVETASRLSAGMAQHVFNVVDCQTFYLRPCPYAELVHPLISQPVVELSLQIPAYVLAHNGKSRGLIREAFAADVPAAIVERYSKGSTTNYFNRMLNGNVVFLREFLLDGALVKQGILDRRELERQLLEDALLRGDNLRSLLDAVRAEAWISAWSGERKRVAA